MSDVSTPPARDARVAAAIAVAGALAVVYFTLFPFDFVSRGASPTEIVRRFSLSPGQLWNPREVPANVVLFVPFGFGLRGALRPDVDRRRAFLWVVLAGLGMSVMVELVQSGWLLRQPSIRDVVANGAGSALGAWSWGRCSDRLRRALRRATAARSRRAWRPACLAVGVLPGTMLVLATVAMGHRAEPAGWDAGFALALGNEPAGGRPWHGSIARVALADRRVTDGEVSDLLAGDRLRVVARAATLVDLDFVDEPSVPSGWRSAGPSGSPLTFGSGGVRLRTSQWLATEAGVADVSRRIDDADAFTVVLEASTDSREQRGPARLLTISNGPDARNLTIAQQGSDLIVRVRSPLAGPNGRSPQFALHGFFSDAVAHRLVLRYDGSRIDLAVDRAGDSRSIELLPGAVPMLTSFPDDVDRIRFTSFGDMSRDLFFSLALFGPWVLSVRACWDRDRRWWGALAAAAPVPLVEFVLVALLPAQPYHGGRVVVVAAGAAASYAVSVVLFTERRPTPVAGSARRT